MRQSPLLEAVPAKPYDTPPDAFLPDGTHNIFDTLSLLQHVATRPVFLSVNVTPPSNIHLSYVQFPILRENNLGNYKTIRDYMFENLGYAVIISTVTNKAVRAWAEEWNIIVCAERET